MRIGINLVFLDPCRMGGGETYARQLVACLQREDRENEYVVFTGRGCPVEFVSPRFERVDCAVEPADQYRRILWEQAFLSRVMKARGLDTAHFPYSTSPLLFAPHYVVTIHDTLRFQQPHLAPFALKHYLQIIQRHIAAGRKRVIALSHNDAKVMIERLGVDPERISVVYGGVDEVFLQGAPGAGEEKGDYVLWLGRIYPHKNLETMLRAYTILRRRGRDLPRLRVAGATEADRRRLAPMLEGLGVAALVSLEGFIPHEQLPPLYRGAQVFCLTSVCENFPLPIVEAMASGAPIVCSDLPATRDMARNAAVFCPPLSPEAFADAIADLLDNPTRRQELAREGLARARDFTWEKAARATIEVYRKAVEER